MKQGMKKLILIALLAAVLVGLTYIVVPKTKQSGCVPTPKTEEQLTEEHRQLTISKDYVKYFGEDCKTAFEILLYTAQTKFKKYDFGIFVESINGVKPDDKHFWKLYLNGQGAQVGADSLQTHKGDVIEWKLEEIK